MSLKHISWVFYIVGTAIVVGSWVGVVSSSIGWLGWLIAMLGWGAQFLPGARATSTADEIGKLERLRSEGAISETEFQIAKDRLLRED